MSDLQTSFQDQRLLVKNLPTLPLALEEARRLAENPNTTIPQLAAVICRDQVLSGKVLKMVNSPAYGFPGRIASIQNALVLLGFNVIKSLIISTLVFESMSQGMTGLWRHSVGCSIACSELGKVLGMKNTDELFIAGLLHDIGKVITAVQLPDAQKEIVQLVQEKDISYHDAEEKVLGLAHPRISAWLAEHWNLPAALRYSMAYHHRPASTQHYTEFVCIVHIGNFLTRLFEFGSGGDENVPQLNPYSFKPLNLNQQKFSLAIDNIGEKFDMEGLDLL